MSKRALIAMACILGLSVLAGCTGPKPFFNECGGNNCRQQGREFDLESRLSQRVGWLSPDVAVSVTRVTAGDR